MTRSYILSTCGTSLLTYRVDEPTRALATRCANKKTYEEIAEPDQKILCDLIAQVQNWLPSASRTDVAIRSAELNTITKFYGDQPLAPRDHHVLLCTDTWLGQQTADLVAAWLTLQGCSVEVKRQKDLQTTDLDAFQLALSELVHWSESTLPEWQKQGYRVVFNLTGGFKSVGGFLQALAMFYADETLYIFESGTTLLRIPRLPVPVTIDTVPVVRSYLTIFRRLANALPTADLSRFPETLLMRVRQNAILSEWGRLVWERAKKQVYAEQIYPSPSSLLVFGLKFADSVKDLAPDRMRILNERIDDLAHYLTDRTFNPPSLDFKKLRGNPMPPSTHECDAWADGSAQRLFGHFDDDDTFVLDQLDKKLSSKNKRKH